jgi:hypothetical protein
MFVIDIMSARVDRKRGRPPTLDPTSFLNFGINSQLRYLLLISHPILSLLSLLVYSRGLP